MNIKIVLASFAVVFLAELGDKTQLTALAFSAQSRSHWSVFLGTSLALVCTTALAVTCGGLLSRVVPPRVMHLASGVMFVLIGLVLLVNLARKTPDAPGQALPEASDDSVVPQTGPVGAFVARQIVGFEEDLSAYIREQGQTLPEGAFRNHLMETANAHVNHVAQLRAFGDRLKEEQRTQIDKDLEKAGAARLADILDEQTRRPVNDAVQRIISRQEAAAQFYIVLAQMIHFHDAKNVLRHLAADEIRLAQELSSLTQHNTQAT